MFAVVVVVFSFLFLLASLCILVLVVLCILVLLMNNGSVGSSSFSSLFFCVDGISFSWRKKRKPDVGKGRGFCGRE